MAPTFPAHLQTLLTSLHAKSLAQESAIPSSTMTSIRSKYTSDLTTAKNEMNDLMLDKFIALDEDKSHFVHGLLRAIGAKTVVEIGTSFGVSTIYLADAVTRDTQNSSIEGLVIGTELEQSKADIARGFWSEAGSQIEGAIELLVGDLHETLVSAEFEKALEVRQIDAVLLDIWPYEALPALELLLPKLRRGAVVITDNSIASAAAYKELLSVFRDPGGHWQTTTVPYKGGLEMSVYQPK